MPFEPSAPGRPASTRAPSGSMAGRLRRSVAVIVLVLAAAGCSDDGGGAADDPDAVASTSFAVSLKDFEIVPDLMRAVAERALVFDVTSDGNGPHTFAVDTGRGVEVTEMLDPGEAATLRVPALEGGDYRIFCTVDGHEDLGMVGVLSVG